MGTWRFRWGSWRFRTFNRCVDNFSETAVVCLGKLTAGHEEYYEREVAGGAEDCYAMWGEAAGEWTGSGARALGLDGTATGGQLRALLEGRGPATGEMLRSRLVHVTGWDVTYSPAKSAGPKRSLRPHHRGRRLQPPTVDDVGELGRTRRLGVEWEPVAPGKLAAEIRGDPMSGAGQRADLLGVDLTAVPDHPPRPLPALPPRRDPQVARRNPTPRQAAGLPATWAVTPRGQVRTPTWAHPRHSTAPPTAPGGWFGALIGTRSGHRAAGRRKAETVISA